MRAYLYRISLGVTVDHYRHVNTLTRQLEELSPNVAAVETGDPNTDIADKLVDDMDRREFLAKAQGYLKPGEQAVLELWAQSYDQSEIAKKLNIPLGTVKTWRYRGLKTLRAVLNIEV